VGIRSVMAVPLIDETGAFGALLVAAARPNAWTEDDADLLQTIADQAAITIRTTRLIDALGQSQRKLARRAGAEQALREIAARITVLREPGDILRDVVTQAGRLVGADGAILDLLDPDTGNLHWAYDDGLSDLFSAEERSLLWISTASAPPAPRWPRPSRPRRRRSRRAVPPSPDRPSSTSARASRR
jgi:GAF domain-containing protein